MSGRLKALAAERLTELGNRLRGEFGAGEPLSRIVPLMTRGDIDVIEMAAQILTQEVESRK